MRKLILISSLLFCFVCFSQEKNEEKVNTLLSINSGLTYSGIRGNEIAEENKYDFNYIGGIGFEFPLKKEKLSFITGLNYENKSFKNNVEVPNFSNPDPIFYGQKSKTKINLKYLNIPLETRFYFGKNKNYFINSGPFVGLFLNYSTKINGEKVEDESDLFKNFDFGWSLGIGTKIKLTEKNNLIIHLKDNLGLINISKVPVYNNGTVKTNSINLVLAYEFKL